MKLAYPVGTPETKKKMMAYQGNFEDICVNLKEIGYKGLELCVRNPQEFPMQEIEGTIDRHGLEVAAIGTGPVVAEDKLTFCALDKETRYAAIERSKRIIDFAAHFSAQVIIGKLRGDLQPGNMEGSRQWMKDAFVEVCEYAQLQNVNITIEPQSRFAVNNLNNTRQTLEWMKEIKAPNLFMMQDTFHMNIEEASMPASLIDAGARNLHMHFAENNRGIPGTGHIDFNDLVKVLESIGYNHYISLEIAQLPNSLTAAQASFTYLDSLLAKKN